MATAQNVKNGDTKLERLKIGKGLIDGLAVKKDIDMEKMHILTKISCIVIKNF